MPGAYKLAFDIDGRNDTVVFTMTSNASSNASFNAALLEQGAVERFEELLLKLETSGQSSPEEGESHALIQKRVTDEAPLEKEEANTGVMCPDSWKYIRGKAVPPSAGGKPSPDISGAYGTSAAGLIHRAILNQTGCVGTWSMIRPDRVFNYPFYVFGFQVTVAYQLFGNITGMPGAYKLAFDIDGRNDTVVFTMTSNASSNASFNAALLEQGAVERFEELLLKLETSGQSSPEEGESHARIHSQRASDDDDDDDDEDRTVMTNIAKNSAS